MKAITITKDDETDVFTLKISNGEHHRVIDLTKEEFEVLRDECNKYGAETIPSYQETFQAAQKQADEIYKKHLEIFFSPKTKSVE